MTIVSKAHHSYNFESHSSLKFSFTNIEGLCSNSVGCEYLCESNSSVVLALSETNLED